MCWSLNQDAVDDLPHFLSDLRGKYSLEHFDFPELELIGKLHKDALSKLKVLPLAQIVRVVIQTQMAVIFIASHLNWWF